MLVQKILFQNWKSKVRDSQTLRRLHYGTTNVSSATQKFLLRSFRTGARHHNTPRDNLHPLGESRGSVPTGNVIKALVFTGAFTGGCFMTATIIEYESARHMMLKRTKQTQQFAWLLHKPKAEDNYWTRMTTEMGALWEQLTPGQKVFVPLCVLNLLVFGLWRVPSLSNKMMTYFCSNPAARVVCWPMFLSTFSHYSAFHIFANMYVLHSFANASVLSLGKEQFLAVYLSGGVISSLASIAYKALTAQAGLSIGASGAIMTILAYVCSRFPDTQLSILFLPAVTFSAGAAIKVIIGIDLAGCLMGWKFFDHAAHLGGALFGIFWAYYGTELWQRRVLLLNYYHDWRRTK